MSPSPLAHKRARAAILTRYRSEGDPELIEARQMYQEARLLDVVERAIAQAPPMMSPETKARLVGLLGGAE